MADMPTITVDIGLAVQQLAASPELAEQMNSLLGLSERYYLSMDNDGHWYVIPVARQQEWIDWLDIPSDDERSWDVPDFAKATGGSPCLVTFTNPEIA